MISCVFGDIADFYEYFKIFRNISEYSTTPGHPPAPPFPMVSETRFENSFLCLCGLGRGELSVVRRESLTFVFEIALRFSPSLEITHVVISVVLLQGGERCILY